MDRMEELQDMSAELDRGLKSLYIAWTAIEENKCDAITLTDALYFVYSGLRSSLDNLQDLLDSEYSEQLKMQKEINNAYTDNN